jgi:hypothetical protein
MQQIGQILGTAVVVDHQRHRLQREGDTHTSSQQPQTETMKPAMKDLDGRGCMNTKRTHADNAGILLI